jgi:hypothetical protein
MSGFAGLEYYTYRGHKVDINGKQFDTSTDGETDATAQQVWEAADGKNYTSQEAATNASRLFHLANPDPMTAAEQALYTMPLDKLKALGERVEAGVEGAANAKLRQGVGDAFVKWAHKLGYSDSTPNAKAMIHELLMQGTDLERAALPDYERAFHNLNKAGLLTINVKAIQAEAAEQADRDAAAYQKQQDELANPDNLSLNDIAIRAGSPNLDGTRW